MPAEKDKRASPTCVRLRPEVLAYLQDCRERTGKSISAQINEAFSKTETPRQQRRPPVEKSMLAQMLVELAAIKALAQEVAHTGGDNCALILEEIRDILIEIRTILMRLLGRRR